MGSSIPPHRLDDLRRLLRAADALELSRSARQRLHWFLFAALHGGNASLTCRHFGISRSTFLRWQKRFTPGNPSSLEEHSRRPHTVRQPETPKHIVALVEQYRKAEPLLSKEDIHERLEREHGITVSASTVGRIIARHGFFFADTPAHQRKRTAKEHIDVSGLSERKKRSAQDAKDSGPESAWGSAASAVGSALLAMIVATGLFTGAPRAQAAESTSYRMYDEFPNYAERDAAQSTTYRMNEDGITWYQQPLAGSTFQIVTAPPASSSSSSAGASSASSETPPSPPSGGCRGHRCASASSQESSAESSARSAESSAPPAGPIPPISSRSSTPALHPAAPLLGELRGERRPAPTDFFTGVQPLCPKAEPCPAAAYSADDTLASLLLDLLLVILLFVLSLALLLLSALARLGHGGKHFWLLPLPLLLKRKEKDDDEALKAKRTAHAKLDRQGKTLLRAVRILVGLAFALLCTAALVRWMPLAFAETTAPLKHVYNGHLLSSTGTPITTAHTIRFSYWKSRDFLSGDLTATGAINTGASNYGSWYETHTVTPDSNGYFSVQMGTGTSLPSMSSFTPAQLQSLFLQVEVKVSGAADTTYELLDVNSSNAAVDRGPVLSVPFALNADMLDRRDSGTGSGSIPVLGSGGLLPVSTIPGGTNSGAFVVDKDSNFSGHPTLQFGGTLAKKLSYNTTNNWFNFNDDVNIQGDLTVTGLINGVDITNIASSTGALKVSSGGGLTIKVAGGSYRLSGNITNYSGGSGIAVSPSTTNYVFFGSGGLKVRTAAFPTDESFIPLAEVDTTAGSVSVVRDRRVLQSDDREKTTEQVFHAEIPNAVYQGDATSNVGQLSIGHDSINVKNFYKWTSSLGTLQDYDIIVRTTIPPSFTGWKDNPLYVTYRTTTGSTLENKLDISVFDTSGVPVTLSGSSTALASTSWATTQLEFDSSATWVAGQDFLVKLKVYARSNYQMQVGDLKIRFKETPKE